LVENTAVMKSYGPTILRLCVGAVFFAHGTQKLLGVWGGPGIQGTISMVKHLGFPYATPLAGLVILTEFVGSILLMAGALSRWAAVALVIEMGVATWKVHWPNGFFLNWSITPGKGHGIEFNLVLIGALLCLLITGPGALSFDERRSRSREAKAAGRARIRKV
jgi:putative oxidoreductase